MRKQLSFFSADDLHHSPRNQREAFLYYMSKMDADMINLILDDNKTYQDAKKEVFIEKLSEALSTFIAKGDTELNVVKGECQNDKCHKGCAGYAFIGNCSDYHLDLIIEGAQNEILDMYYCSDFKSCSEKLDENKNFCIDIKHDEEAKFVPPEWFLMSSHQCSIACDEIMRDGLPLQVVNIQLAERWLEKYAELYDSVDPIFTPAAFSKFNSLYYEVKNLVPMFNMKELAEKGIGFYNNRIKRSRNEKMLLYWLVEFEQLKDDLISLDYFYFDIEDKAAENYVKINRSYEVYLCAGDFAAQLKFLRIYIKYYWDMLRKYTTVPAEQWDTLVEGTEASEKRISLKYHLQQRGMA